MKTKWKPLKDADGRKGIRYREHPVRKHGAVPDRYYSAVYWWQGKTINEKIGWASDGWTPSKCFNLLASIKRNQSKGTGPCTLSELRKQGQLEREQAERVAKAQSITLDDYWPEYYEYAKRSKKPSSYSKEESHYRMWLSPLLGKLPIREIDMPQWDILVAALSKADKSVRMKEYVTGTLRRILKHSYHRRLIDQPPPTGKRIGATGPGNSNRRLRVINPDEAMRIMQKLKDTDIYAWRITRFAFLTGARASECYNLRWRDIDHSRQLIRFPETKNRDSRTVFITGALSNLLNDLPPSPIDAFVFTRGDGKPYSEAPYSFRVIVDDLELNRSRSDRDRISFHTIRHSVATELAKTLNTRDLMDVMGWRTVQMAMRYVHGNEIAKHSALSRLEESMKPTKTGDVIPIHRKINQ
jgi:integrase